MYSVVMCIVVIVAAHCCGCVVNGISWFGLQGFLKDIWKLPPEIMSVD